MRSAKFAFSPPTAIIRSKSYLRYKREHSVINLAGRWIHCSAEHEAIRGDWGGAAPRTEIPYAARQKPHV